MAIPRNLGNLAQGADTNGVLGVTKGGTGSTSTTFVNLATNVTGTLPAANGGVGLTSPGTAGNVLVSNGTAWTSAAPNAGALTLLSTVTASASSTVDVETTFSSTYDTYMLVISGATVSNNNNSINVHLKLNGAYVTTNTYKHHGSRLSSNDALYNGVAADVAAGVPLCGGIDNAAVASAEIRMFFSNPTSTTQQKLFTWHGTIITAAGGVGTLYLSNVSGSGTNTGTGALTGVRFFPGSGTISGKFRLYGIANS